MRMRFALLVIAALWCGGCSFHFSVGDKPWGADNLRFATAKEAGQRPDKLFHAGETVWFLYDLHQAKPGPDGKCNVALEAQVTKPDGKQLDKTTGTVSLAADKGNFLVLDYHLPLVGGVQPGTYKVKVDVKDTVGNQSTTVEDSFTVADDATPWRADKPRFSSGKEERDDKSFRPGEPFKAVWWVRGFKLDDAGKCGLKVNVKFIGPKGDTVLDKSGMLSDEMKGLAAAFPVTHTIDLPAKVDAGTYRIVLTVEDVVGKQSPLTVEDSFTIKP